MGGTDRKKASKSKEKENVGIANVEYHPTDQNIHTIILVCHINEIEVAQDAQPAILMVPIGTHRNR